VKVPWKSGAAAPRKAKVNAGFSPRADLRPTASFLVKIKPARGRVPGQGSAES
jgi:hypothetical protein